MAYAVVRVRGHSKVNHDIEDTMLMMKLNRVNHCVILPENDTVKGMLQKTKDYVTFGEVSEQTLARMVKFRGRLVGDKAIDDEVVKERTEYTSILALSRAVCANEYTYARDEGRQAPLPPHASAQGV